MASTRTLGAMASAKVLLKIPFVSCERTNELRTYKLRLEGVGAWLELSPGSCNRSTSTNRTGIRSAKFGEPVQDQALGHHLNPLPFFRSCSQLSPQCPLHSIKRIFNLGLLVVTHIHLPLAFSLSFTMSDMAVPSCKKGVF